MSGTALALHYGFGRKRAAYTVLGGLIGAAGLEAFFGICLACKMFPALVRLGIVPETACEDCADVTPGGRARSPPASLRRFERWRAYACQRIDAARRLDQLPHPLRDSRGEHGQIGVLAASAVMPNVSTRS